MCNCLRLAKICFSIGEREEGDTIDEAIEDN